MRVLAIFYAAASLLSAARSIPAGLLGDDDNPLVVVYIESWSVWERSFLASTLDKLMVNRDLPYRKLVINHAFSVQDNGDCSLRTTDLGADADTPDAGYGIAGWGNPWDGPEVSGVMGSLMTMKKNRPEIILLPSIGGWSRSQEFQHCIQEENRAKFADAIIQHIRYLGLDGVDFDWEYPSCEGGCGCQGEEVCSSTPNKAGHGDWEVYKSFLTYLRQRLDSAGDEIGKYLYVTMALGMNPDLLQGQGKWDVPTPFDFLCADNSPVDWMNLMTYDYFGPWAALTGPLSPLSDTPDITDDDRMNIKFGLDYIKQTCKNMDKLTMGLATYGKSWAGVPKQGSVPGLWQQASANPITGDGTYSSGPGTLSIWDIVANYRPTCSETFDEVSQTATMFCDSSPKGLSNVFISYESGEVWRRKMAMARSYGMSGGMLWAASDLSRDGTDTTNELFAGLFSGWTGRDYAPPAVTAPTSVTRLKRWTGYPCPMRMEYDTSCTVSGSPEISFPSDETVNLAGSAGVRPTEAPSVSTNRPPTTSTTTTTPYANGGIVDECQRLITSTNDGFIADCKAKCEYYASEGSSKCGVVVSGSELAQCVSRLHTYCTYSGNSTGVSTSSSSTTTTTTSTTSSTSRTTTTTTRSTSSTATTAGGDATQGACEDLVAGTGPQYDDFCKGQCPNYVIGGPRAPWCQGTTADAQAACVIQEWKDACQLV